MTSALQTLRSQQLYRRVKNHVTRGQYDGVAMAFDVARTSAEQQQFAAGFLSGAFSVIADSRTRSTTGLVKFLREKVAVAQLVLPVQHQDKQLKQKLTLVFFLSNHEAKTGVNAGLAQNALKDFTPDIWTDLLDTPEFLVFGYGLYQATGHRNDMLEKIHIMMTDAEFLHFCNNAKRNFAGRKKLESDDIAQLIEDRAEFLDMSVNLLVNTRLAPAWEKYKETHLGRSDVDLGIKKVIKDANKEDVSIYPRTIHYIMK